MSRPNINAIADELERTARCLREHGDRALRLASDWQSPLASGGSGLRCPKNEVSRPTENRAIALIDGHGILNDPALEQDRLASALQAAWLAASTARLRVVSITRDITIQNGRAGIGSCTDCHKYLDGTKGNRLSGYKTTGEPVCTGCRSARDRRDVNAACSSSMTHENVPHRCDRAAGHTGKHQGDGWQWSSSGVEKVA